MKARDGYVAHTGTAPETEVDVLARVYQFVLFGTVAGRRTVSQNDDPDKHSNCKGALDAKEGHGRGR